MKIPFRENAKYLKTIHIFTSDEEQKFREFQSNKRFNSLILHGFCSHIMKNIEQNIENLRNKKKE